MTENQMKRQIAKSVNFGYTYKFPLLLDKEKPKRAEIITDLEMLGKISEPILEIDDEIRELAEIMAYSMYDAGGIGLAAVQIGVLKQMITIDIGDGLLTLINPKIVGGKGVVFSNEGCLSYIGIQMRIKRRKSVVVKAFDLEGNPVTINAEGLLAICLAHEVEHTVGVSFIDKKDALWMDTRA